MTLPVESWASSAGTRRSMLANTRRDTKPELAVRRLLFAAGLRYRVDYPLPFDRRRRCDIAFTRQKIAIFIDGCFWHSCPEHGATPQTNASYWGPKLLRNRDRDAETDARLTQFGWVPLRFWEHEHPSDVASGILAATHGLNPG